MPLLARILPSLFGLLLIGAMLPGKASSAANLCAIVRTPQAVARCLAIPYLAPSAWAAAIALLALTLLLLWRWQSARMPVITYESDAERWVMLGWMLAIGGAISLLAGLALIGSGGWPFSAHTRHIKIQTGQLPVTISTVQRRYLANYSGGRDDPTTHALCAGFGEVTFANRSRFCRVALDLGLRLESRHAGASGPCGSMPGRHDLTAVARRGLGVETLFRNPIELQPRQALKKELVFVIRFAVSEARLPDNVLQDADYTFVLDVKDRISGQAVSLTLPAQYRG